jgi:hypothetical protein
MSRSGVIRWCAAFAALALMTAYAAAQPGGDKTEPGATPDTRALDAKMLRLLTPVINRGAALYNRDDFAGCYRLYEGSLLTLRPLLDHRPELQKEIARALAAADRDPQVFRRAFTLRTALDAIRKDLSPRKNGKSDTPVASAKKSKGGTTVASSKKTAAEKKAAADKKTAAKKKAVATASLKEKAKEKASEPPVKVKEKEDEPPVKVKEKEKESEPPVKVKEKEKEPDSELELLPKPKVQDEPGQDDKKDEKKAGKKEEKKQNDKKEEKKQDEGD